MTSWAHVFVETSFIFGAFRMPSKRHRNALALKERFAAGEIKLYVPFLCFQEARNLIAKSLPSNRCADILEFQRFAAATQSVAWDFNEVKKLLDAATSEVNRTKAIYQKELADFVIALAEGIVHGTNEIFSCLESLDLDDQLEYNDKLDLASVLIEARKLKESGVGRTFFACEDKKHLQPTPQRPKLSRYYDEAGVEFLTNFVLPAQPSN